MYHKLQTMKGYHHENPVLMGRSPRALREQTQINYYYYYCHHNHHHHHHRRRHCCNYNRVTVPAFTWRELRKTTKYLNTTHLIEEDSA
jgi:hypothetical protein